MAKKKSLGSSPIGFHTSNGSMGFIPDLGVSESRHSISESQEVTSTSTYLSKATPTESSNKPNPKPDLTEKKIVSYNLEVDLISRIKAIANDQGIYYSSLVSIALKTWIDQHCGEDSLSIHV